MHAMVFHESGRRAALVRQWGVNAAMGVRPRGRTGVLLFGKTLLATREIHRQFRQRTVGKTYLAVAAGVPARTAFTVDAAIGRHTTDKCGVCWTRRTSISSSSDVFIRVAHLSRAWPT